MHAVRAIPCVDGNAKGLAERLLEHGRRDAAAPGKGGYGERLGHVAHHLALRGMCDLLVRASRTRDARRADAAIS